MEELKYKYRKVGLSRICGLFGITRQAYYQHYKQEERIRLEQKLVIDAVKEIRYHHRSIGTRKLYHIIQPFLKQNAIKMGRDALFRLLSDECLLIKKHKRRIRTTMSFHRFYKWPNLIKNYIPQRPMEIYVSDITYWKINRGHLYISLITDAYSHKIVGYNVADNLEAIESKKALEQALVNRDGVLIHHSDRGIQYCSNEYVKLLQENQIKISMTEESDPRENAIAERVNGILKNEYLVHYYVNTLEEAKIALSKAVNLYNDERPHLSVDYLTPNQVHQSKAAAKKVWKNYYRKKEDVKVF